MARRSYTVIYEPAEKSGFYAHIPALDVTIEGETHKDAKEMARNSGHLKIPIRTGLDRLAHPPDWLSLSGLDHPRHAALRNGGGRSAARREVRRLAALRPPSKRRQRELL